MKTELHLFIIWPKARNLEEKILKDIKHNFKVLDLCEMCWSDLNYSNNLTRFYGEKLPSGSYKERHCGKGPFILVVVRDRNPVYEKKSTSKGIKLVNANLFNAKSRYRDWTGGGHKVHATNNPYETRHDLSLLFGMAAEPYFCGDIIHNAMRRVDRDLVGANGWDNIEELFYVLNHTVKYVVLRNFESLPHNYAMESHDDIDLLVDNYRETVYVVNATKIFKPKYRVHYRVKIGGEYILFDFRYVGDSYYDELWEKDILERRRISKKGFYIPSIEDYFFSLLYHGLVHKQMIVHDYCERLVTLASEMSLNGVNLEFLKNVEAVKLYLKGYLERQGYSFTEPTDLSVYYNNEIYGIKRVSLRRRAIMEVKNISKPLKDPIRLIKDKIIWFREVLMQLIVKSQ